MKFSNYLGKWENSQHEKAWNCKSLLSTWAPKPPCCLLPQVLHFGKDRVVVDVLEAVEEMISSLGGFANGEECSGWGMSYTKTLSRIFRHICHQARWLYWSAGLCYSVCQCQGIIESKIKTKQCKLPEHLEIQLLCERNLCEKQLLSIFWLIYFCFLHFSDAGGIVDFIPKFIITLLWFWTIC